MYSTYFQYTTSSLLQIVLNLYINIVQQNQMDQIKKLYQKTKQSLLCTNRNNPEQGIQIIKQVQLKLKTLKQQYLEYKKDLASLEVISLNNLACAYNKKGKHKASLYYLQLASQIQSAVFHDVQISCDPECLHQVATTHSNMCAVFSQMGDHQKAYKQINKSIQLLQKTKQTGQSDALVVFYFNCAVELQYLNRLNEAHKVAQKGCSLSMKSNKEMQNRFIQLLEKLQDKIKKRQKKVAKLIISNLKMKNQSIADEKQLLSKRGQSLNVISHNRSANDSIDHSRSKKSISKQFSAYATHLPYSKIPGATKTIRPNLYPSVKLPIFAQNTPKLGLNLGLQQRKNIITLYEPKNRDTRVPRQQRMSLKRKQNTLQKLIAEQGIY